MKGKFKGFVLFSLLLSLSVFTLSEPFIHIAKASPGWVSPTGHEDTSWTNEIRAYDDDEATFAQSNLMMGGVWSAYLILTHDELYCSGLRLWVQASATCEMDIFYDGSYHNVFSGTWTGGSYQTVYFDSEYITKFRTRFKQTSYPYSMRLVFEADFSEVAAGDLTPPTYSNIGTNATEVNEWCGFSCYWEDETELSGYIFGWNGTGSFLNDTWASLSGTSSWANKTKQLPANPDAVTYQWWCNDTSDNWNTTGLQTLNVTECYIVARFKYSPLRPYINENVTFNGTHSVCSGTIDSYNWTFGDESSDTGSMVYHVYSSSGLFTVNLTVSGVNLTDSFTLQINVTDYHDPVARFEFSPERPYVNQQITFNASTSVCLEGTITTYSWSFGGSGVTATHNYSSAGSYTVTLTITDSNSKQDGWSLNVNVSAYLNPVARFSFSPERPYISQTVTFNATNSTDPDGSISSYSWNFGDGSAQGSGVTTTHPYSTVNLFTVTLTITDSQSLTNSTSLKINVTDYIGPTACFTFSPSNPRYNTSINFNASQSYDPDGTIQTYSWTFGDGNSSSGVTVSHTYNSNGEFTVTLNTTDDHSKTDVFSVTFNVTANTGPVAFFTYKPFFPFPDTPMYFYSDESSDSDGTISSYFWDFGDTQNSSSMNPSHSYTTDGNFNVTLTITDNDGGSDSYTRSIGVSRGAASDDRPSQTVIIEEERMTLLGEVYTVCSVSIDGFINNYMSVEVLLYLENVLTEYLNVSVFYTVRTSLNVTQVSGNTSFFVPPRIREEYNFTFNLPLDSNFFADVENSGIYTLYLHLQYITGETIVKSSEITRPIKVGDSHGMLRWAIGLIVIAIVIVVAAAVVYEILTSRKKEIKKALSDLREFPKG